MLYAYVDLIRITNDLKIKETNIVVWFASKLELQSILDSIHIRKYKFWLFFSSKK